MSQEENINDVSFSSGLGSSFIADSVDLLSQDSTEGQIDPKELMVSHEHSQIVYGHFFYYNIIIIRENC
jgi:hypothetical protein